jgi:hypothetical protein
MDIFKSAIYCGHQTYHVDAPSRRDQIKKCFSAGDLVETWLIHKHGLQKTIEIILLSRFKNLIKKMDNEDFLRLFEQTRSELYAQAMINSGEENQMVSLWDLLAAERSRRFPYQPYVIPDKPATKDGQAVYDDVFSAPADYIW